MELDFILTPYFDKLEKRLLSRIDEMFAKSRANNVDPPLSRKQAAKYLGVSVQTLDRRLKSGEIPPKLMHGEKRKKVFFASELESYLKKS